MEILYCRKLVVIVLSLILAKPSSSSNISTEGSHFVNSTITSITATVLPTNLTNGTVEENWLAWEIGLTLGFTTTFVVSVIGNALVIHVVRVTPSMHTSINMYIANMASSDIISTILCVPVSVKFVFIRFNWIGGNLGVSLCRIVNLMFYTSFACSTFNLVAIAVDRYLAITRPLYRYSSRVVKITIFLIWAASVLLSIPVTLAYTNRFPLYNSKPSSVCYDADRDDLYAVGVIIMGILCYVIPLAVSSALYILTGCRLRMRSKDIIGSNGDRQKEKARESTLKAAKMMATVVAVFALCWAPFFAYHVTKGLYRDGDLFHIVKLWYRSVAFLLAAVNGAINPCLYAVFNQNFRSGFKEAILCRKRSTRRGSSECQSVGKERALTLNSIILNFERKIRAGTI